MAMVGGRDAAALTFLVVSWAIIVKADSVHTRQLAVREDETKGSATVPLVGASVTSLLGVGFALRLARSAVPVPSTHVHQRADRVPAGSCRDQ
jgi:hypothetical protein